MIAKFTYVWWEPPKLLIKEEEEIAQSIYKHGYFFHLCCFMKLPFKKVIISGINSRKIVKFWLPVISYFCMMVIGVIVTILFKRGFGNDIGQIIFGLGVVGILCFVTSVIVSTINYAIWIYKLRKKYSNLQSR